MVLALWFLMSHYDVSLPTLINKVAVKLTDGEQDSVLFRPSEKYLDTPLHRIKHGGYPRILVTPLHQDGLANVFAQRIAIIKAKGLGFRHSCTNNTLTARLNCYVIEPSKVNLDQLLEAIESFHVIKPTVSGNKGNAWQLAFAIDVLKASPNLTARAHRRLDAKLTPMLQRYLLLLDNDGASLWHSRATLSAQAFLIAAVLDQQNTANKRMFQRALGHFEQTYQAISATETWPGGYNYWINNRAFITMLAFSAYANLQVDTLSRNEVIAVIRRIGLAHIHFVRPDFKMTGWADEGPRIDLKDETGRVIDLIAQLTTDPVFYYFAQSIRQRYGMASYYSAYRWLLPWLYAPEYHLDTAGPAKRNTANLLLPMAPFLSNNILFGQSMRNHLAIRSGWRDDDTLITYQAGHIFSHHQHYNAGHFTVFKGAPLIVDAAQYNGSVMSQRRRHIDIRTLAKNSLLIEQLDEIVRPNHIFRENVAAGGQRIVMPTGSAITSMDHWRELRDSGVHVGGAKLISYVNSPLNYVTISSDLTSAYNSTRYSTAGNDAKVKQVLRHIAYINAYDLLLSYDKILATSEQYKTKWLAHTVNKPLLGRLTQHRGTAQDGIASSVANTLKITNGLGQLELMILAPNLLNTTLIGGQKYQHYVESDGHSGELNGQFFEQGYEVKPWYDHALWRVEVSPVDQQALTRYMVVMQPSLVADAKPPVNSHKLNHSNGGVAQLDKLVVLWPNDKLSWVFNLSQHTDQLAIFLDKPRQLILTTNNQPPVIFDGKVGFNFFPVAFQRNTEISLASTR